MCEMGHTGESWRPIGIKGLMHEIGPLLTRKEEARRRYAIQTDARHINPLGIIHGGLMTTLADQVMALVAWEAVGRKPVVSVHMDFNFIDPAIPGDFLEADAQLIEKKGSIIFMEAFIGTSGRCLLKASSIMKIVSSRDRETSNDK